MHLRKLIHFYAEPQSSGAKLNTCLTELGLVLKCSLGITEWENPQWYFYKSLEGNLNTPTHTYTNMYIHMYLY